MPITELVEKAWAAVEAAEIPDEVKIPAFAEVIHLLAAGLRETPDGPRQWPEKAAERGAQGADERITQLARAIEAPPEQVAEVFKFGEDGEVEIVLGTVALSDTNAAAVRELALLITGARQLSEADSWTSTQAIRAQAEYFGKADGNFSTYVREMTDEFSFSGKGRGLKVKLRKPGQEKFARLVSELTSNG